jgi:hypothetical protein
MNPSNAFVPPVWNYDTETPASSNSENNKKPLKKKLFPHLFNPWFSGLPVMWFSGSQANEGKSDTQPEQQVDCKK